MSGNHNRWAFLTLFFLLLAVVGCGSGRPATVPVEGTLTWEDNGKPVAGANVRFVPTDGGREAYGYTGKDGEYSLSSFTQGDGAIPGEHSVIVTKVVAQAITTGAAEGTTPEERTKAMKMAFDKQKAVGSKVTEPIPSTYHDAKTTPLKWKVASGGGKADFKLKRN